MKKYLLPALCLVSVIHLGASCDDPATSEPMVKSRDRIWEASVEVLGQRGYPGFEEFDRDAASLETRWRVKSAVHAHEGKRHKIWLEIVPAEPEIDPKTGEKQYLVQVLSEWERNEDITNPLVTSAAEWREMGRDPEEEDLILGQIWMATHDWEDFGPSAEIKRQWEQQEKFEKEIDDLKSEEERLAEELERLEREAQELEDERNRLGKKEETELEN